MSDKICGDVYEPENGETVTPCHLPEGHEGLCQGYCLGSHCTWEKKVEPPCAAFGLYEGHDSETEEQTQARHKRVKALVPDGAGLQTYALFEGGWTGGLTFLPTPVEFTNLWMIEGAKLVWACRAKDWNDACRLYHEFMGWNIYQPIHEEIVPPDVEAGAFNLHFDKPERPA